MRRCAVLGLAVVVGALGAAPAVALPPGPPPKVAGAAVAPPPAWIEAGSTQRWLAYSSYCWKTACVDFLPPAMRPDVPVVTVRRGQAVRLHFGFAPSSVTVAPVGGGSRRLPPARTISWRPPAGLLAITAKSKTGSAGYLVRIRLR